MAILKENSLINDEYFHKYLLEKLNEGMKSAAEPIIKKAVEDAETEMRKKLGSMVVGFLDGYIEFERMGHTLRIIVKND
jgi:formate dehydrogenase maturation protein FdhE